MEFGPYKAIVVQDLGTKRVKLNVDQDQVRRAGGAPGPQIVVMNLDDAEAEEFASGKKYVVTFMEVDD